MNHGICMKAVLGFWQTEPFGISSSLFAVLFFWDPLRHSRAAHMWPVSSYGGRCGLAYSELRPACYYGRYGPPYAEFEMSAAQ